MQEQATRPIQVLEVALPVQSTQVLGAEWNAQQDVEGDCTLSIHEANAATFFWGCGNVIQQSLGQEQELGASFLGLQLPEQRLVLLRKIEWNLREPARQFLEFDNPLVVDCAVVPRHLYECR